MRMSTAQSCRPLRSPASSDTCGSSLCSTSFTMTSPPCMRTQACKRSEEHTSELQSLMRISYAVFCLKKKNKKILNKNTIRNIHQTIMRHQTYTHIEDICTKT